MTNNDTKLILSQDYLLKEHLDKYYLINITNGNVQDINQTGFLIAKAFNKEASIIDVCKNFGFSENDNYSDTVLTFANKLIEKNILRVC